MSEIKTETWSWKITCTYGPVITPKGCFSPSEVPTECPGVDQSLTGHTSQAFSDLWPLLHMPPVAGSSEDTVYLRLSKSRGHGDCTQTLWLTCLQLSALSQPTHTSLASLSFGLSSSDQSLLPPCRAGVWKMLSGESEDAMSLMCVSLLSRTTGYLLSKVCTGVFTQLYSLSVWDWISPISSIPSWPEYGGGFNAESTCPSTAGVIDSLEDLLPPGLPVGLSCQAGAFPG